MGEAAGGIESADDVHLPQLHRPLAPPMFVILAPAGRKGAAYVIGPIVV